MSKFAAILTTDFKRFFCSKKIIVLLLFILLLGYVVFQDCGDYKNTVAKVTEFQEIESELFNRITNFTLYRAMGFKVLYIPGPLSILFNNSGFFSGCTSQVSGLISLNIVENLKGPALFEKKPSLPMDFSGILLVFGTLYAILFLGYPLLRDNEYLKMFSTSLSTGPLHFSLVFSRLIILALQLFLVFCCMYVLPLIKGISLPGEAISLLTGHFVASLLLLGFFLIIGAIAGQKIKSPWKSVTSIIIVWAIFIFLIPGPVNAFVVKRAQKITSQYKTELDKLNVTFNFEKKAVEKYGKFDRKKIETARMIIEDFWKNEYKEITALEEEQKNEIAGIVDTYNKINLFTPVTFYNLTADELSNRGYGAFLKFYTYVKDLQVEFVRFIIDRTYYNDPRVLVSFVKGDENIFKGKGKLPPGFKNGVLINLGILIILYLISFFIFKESLYKIRKEDITKLGNVDIKLENGNCQVWLVKKDYFSKLLYNLFSGNYTKMRDKGFTGKVIVNGADISTEKSNEDFLYISKPEYIPGDMKVKHFISFLTGMLKIAEDKKKAIIDSPAIKPLSGKTFDQLSKSERFSVLLALLESGKKQVYLIDDMATGLPVDCAIKLKRKMEELKEQENLVIYLTTTRTADSKPVEMDTYFYKGKSWEYMVGEYEEKEKEVEKI